MIKEDQIKQWIKDGGREKPSQGFADRIMAQIELQPSSTFVYEPVISQKGIRIIIGGIILVFALVILSYNGGTESNPIWLKALDTLRGINTNLVNPGWSLPLDLPIITLSPIYGYALIIFSGALIIVGRLESLVRT